MLIGEEDWQAIEETLHLMAIPGMAESIIEGGKTAIEDCLEENEDVEYKDNQNVDTLRIKEKYPCQ